VRVGLDGGLPLVDRVAAAMLGMQRQSWEQGVAGQALLALGRTDLARVLARDAVARQTPDGRLAEIDGAGLVNGAANLEAVDLLAASGDPAAAAAAARQRDWLARTCPRAADGTLFHLTGSRQVWADTVYMVVPTWTPADAGADPPPAADPPRAADPSPAALQQLAGHRRRLFDPVSGLYAARWDEDEGRLVDARHWGTGNGWVAAATARAVHRWCPSGSRTADAAELVGHMRGLVDACLALRRPDGSFGDVLDDPASFSDVTCGLMLAYTAATGIVDGWLPTDRLPVVRSLLATARERVDADGLVTGVCGAPPFDRPGTAVEAQAVFGRATVGAAEAGAGGRRTRARRDLTVRPARRPPR